MVPQSERDPDLGSASCVPLMLGDLQSGREIARESERLLNSADAAGRWPTRVADIVAASKLEVSEEESPFSISVLKRAPKHLARAVAALGSGRIRAILDRKERAVYVDPTIENAGRRSFLELHEVGHDILPWQSGTAYAENDLTLSQATKVLFEREANQAAAELLFQGLRFAAMANEYETGMAAVEELKRRTGASLRATHRRYAEGHSGAVCGIYLAPSPCRTEPTTAYRRREISQSPEWTKRFGSSWPHVLDAGVFPFITAIADPELGRSEVLSWPDLDSEPIPLNAEAIRTRFGIALLLWVPRREILRRRRRLVIAAG
jgi:hypothetical protein